ncbi:MAG: methyltransferase domain-containing protein [Chloroflexi bacterium]|nr:methyltransferase domain-containing protein [Chloroflexota bacterium]
MKNWSNYEFETTSCPICGPNAEQKLRYDFAPFRVVACRECGLMFLSPRFTKDNILQLYQGQDYYVPSSGQHGYDEYLELHDCWLKTFKKRLHAIQQHQPAGRVLDIGCGPGFFLEAASEAGYDVWGIDPSEYIVQVAQKKFGQQIHRGTIADVNFEPESFDLVTAFDVFEHIYQPVDFLSRVHRLLKPNGVFAITTPNPASLLARISGKSWVSFKMPEHVFYWSPKTVRRALERDFDILEIRRAGQYATAGFLFRRLFKITDDPSKFAQAIIKLLSRISVYADNGSMTVIARKK